MLVSVWKWEKNIYFHAGLCFSSKMMSISVHKIWNLLLILFLKPMFWNCFLITLPFIAFAKCIYNAFSHFQKTNFLTGSERIQLIAKATMTHCWRHPWPDGSDVTFPLGLDPPEHWEFILLKFQGLDASLWLAPTFEKFALEKWKAVMKTSYIRAKAIFHVMPIP